MTDGKTHIALNAFCPKKVKRNTLLFECTVPLIPPWFGDSIKDLFEDMKVHIYSDKGAQVMCSKERLRSCSSS